MVLGLRIRAKGTDLAASGSIVVQDECKVALPLDILVTLLKGK